MNVKDFTTGYGTIVCNECGTDHEHVKELSEGRGRNLTNVRYVCEDCYNKLDKEA